MLSRLLSCVWNPSRQLHVTLEAHHIVGPWVTDNIDLSRDLRTGTQYVGNWASRVSAFGDSNDEASKRSPQKPAK